VTSQAQVDANRENAKSSTGPRTVEGKARSSKNAETHGLFAREVIIQLGDSREDPESLESLNDGMWEQFRPDGRLEEEIVSEMVANLWRRRRLHRFELATVERGTATAVQRWDQDDTGVGPVFSLEEMASEFLYVQALIEEVASGPSAEPSKRLMHYIVEEAAQTDDIDIDQIFGVAGGSEAHGRLPEPTPGVFRHVVEALCKALNETEEQLWARYRERWEQRLSSGKAAIEGRQLTEDLARRLEEIPDDADINKIIRYEAHLSRQFARLLDQLLRLQALRKDQGSGASE